MRIYVWDNSALRNLGTIMPLDLARGAWEYIKTQYIDKKLFYTHEYVQDELKTAKNKGGKNDPDRDGIESAYEWVKSMKKVGNIIPKDNDQLLAWFQEMIGSLDWIGKRAGDRKPSDIENKIRGFLESWYVASKTPADPFVILTAKFLRHTRIIGNIIIVADDSGIREVAQHIDIVLRGEKPFRVIGYKDFLKEEGLELYLRKAGSNPK